MEKNDVFKLCDVVRQTAYEIHKYLGPGHVEKVYENALAHRLQKQGIAVEQQHQSKVFDEDGELLGIFYADLFVDNQLIIEVKAVKLTTDEHVAQMLGYLYSSKIDHGLLVNFGGHTFQIKKYASRRILPNE